MAHDTDVHMRSPANAHECATQVVDKQAPFVPTNTQFRRQAAPPAETPSGRSAENRLAVEVPNATSNPGVLGSSLQRLYDSEGAAGVGPILVSPSQASTPSETTPDLTESLLEAVFEISEFDPLPHLNNCEDEFGFGFLGGSQYYPASAKTANSKLTAPRAAPRPGSQSPLNTSPEALPGMERRKLPRRESECVVSICLCQGEERLTADRIAWLLHSTKLKGQLIDVSMSGVAFHFKESLAAGSRILLRISNRTIDKQVDTSATILRFRAVRDGGWDMVCRFEKNLTFEQIHTVGRSLFAATIV